MTFADALRDAAEGRRRVTRDRIWRAFKMAYPIEASDGDARERLAAALAALVDAGVLKLPVGRAGWDHSATPPVPEWIQLERLPAPAPVVDPATIPWAPELSFVASMPRLDSLADALVIQRWLGSGGRTRPVVPMRERSVGLFGREKRLDELVRTPLFGPGRLSLELLRCFSMSPPLAFELGPAGTEGRPCLVIENHHTWWSFCGWNARVGQYSAVVYGAGGGFGREAVAFLAEHSRRWGTSVAEYFGDLDPEGLAIPRRAALDFAADLHIDIVPATRWYARLLDLADAATLPVLAPYPLNDGIQWLGGDLEPRVRRYLSAGVRVPQELLGTEQLADHDRFDQHGDPPL
jgi:hypothetical protein